VSTKTQTSPEAVVDLVLGVGYFGAIDRGDMTAAVMHVAEDVEMVFDPQEDLRGRDAVLASLETPKQTTYPRFHRISDILAAERGTEIVALGSLETGRAKFRLAVVIDTPTRLITHFLTQELPRSDDPGS
jgi:hypothetical protein